MHTDQKEKTLMRLTTIELSRSAFRSNIQHLSHAAGGAQIALVVKSNAYGHGSLEMSKFAEEIPGVTWLCAAGLSQAIELKKSGTNKIVFALSYLDGDLEEAISLGIHMMVYTLEDVIAINTAAQNVGKHAYIHIKIDTGMSRLGILPHEAVLFIKAVQLLAHITIYGLATHLCDTPNPDQTFSKQQLKTFDEVREIVKAIGVEHCSIHAQSSSALSVAAESSYSHVRVGAAAYGIWKSEDHKNLIRKQHPAFDLSPVMLWKTKIIQLKKVPAGASVGYDRTFVTQRPSILAVAPIGYWDGYPRSLSNHGTAIIRGQYAPVVGIVSMNMTTFDVTDIPEVTLHDDIFLLGDTPGIRAHEVAQSARLITNEVITHLHPSIERIAVAAAYPSCNRPSYGAQ